VDLYQIHRWDEATPIEETLRALDDLVRAGKVRYIGASNFAAWQLSRANLLAEVRGWTPFVSIQPHYHMFERGIEQELIPYCNAYNVGILPYFPLAGGFLTGKYRVGGDAVDSPRAGNATKLLEDERAVRILEALTGVADARGASMTAVALAWLRQQPTIGAPIASARSTEQLAALVESFDLVLSDEELAALA